VGRADGWQAIKTEIKPVFSRIGAPAESIAEPVKQLGKQVEAVVANATPVSNSPAPEAADQGKSFFLIAAYCFGLVLGVILLAQRLPIIGTLVIGHALAGLIVLNSARARSGAAPKRERMISDAVIALAPAVFAFGIYHAASAWCYHRMW
jgi:hypothetical protein